MEKVKDEKVISRFKTSLKHYVAETYGIRCIDQRFETGNRRLEKIVFKGREVDPGHFAGASLGVIDRKIRGAVFHQIKIAIAAHHTESVTIADHSDCAAYGGSKRFNNRETEKEFHKKQLRKARGIIQKKFKGVPVYLFYIDDEVGLIQIM